MGIVSIFLIQKMIYVYSAVVSVEAALLVLVDFVLLDSFFLESVFLFDTILRARARGEEEFFFLVLTFPGFFVCVKLFLYSFETW